MYLGSSESKVPITKLAIRWLYTVEAYKPAQISGRPERVEPVAQPATSLMRWPVFICDGPKRGRRDLRRSSEEYRGTAGEARRDPEGPGGRSDITFCA